MAESRITLHVISNSEQSALTQKRGQPEDNDLSAIEW